MKNGYRTMPCLEKISAGMRYYTQSAKVDFNNKPIAGITHITNKKLDYSSDE